MAAELQPITMPAVLSEQVVSIRGSEESRIILSEIGGGVLRFTEAVFPDVYIDRILVQQNEREQEGRGPHFDVYQNYINREHPWIAIYNLSGYAKMTTLDLPEDLARSYLDRYPEPSDAAFTARRLFAEIALEAPGAEPTNSDIKPGTGIVISQGPNGPHVIHDIVPTTKDAGKYLKFVVPSGTKEAKERMTSGGYETLDEVITNGIGGASNEKEVASGTTAPQEPELRSRTVRTPMGLGRPRTLSPRSDGRRSCNLD